MLYYALKVAVSAFVIVAIAEIAKRSTGFAALLAAIPLTSLLAFMWMHFEGAEPARIAELSGQIFWLVAAVPDPVFVLAVADQTGTGFLAKPRAFHCRDRACYLVMLPVLRKFGVQL